MTVILPGERRSHDHCAAGVGLAAARRPALGIWGSAVGDQWIVFTGYRPGSGHSEVFRIAPDGARLALLTFNEVSFDAATGSLPGTP